MKQFFLFSLILVFEPLFAQPIDNVVKIEKEFEPQIDQKEKITLLASTKDTSTTRKNASELTYTEKLFLSDEYTASSVDFYAYNQTNQNKLDGLNTNYKYLVRGGLTTMFLPHLEAWANPVIDNNWNLTFKGKYKGYKGQENAGKYDNFSISNANAQVGVSRFFKKQTLKLNLGYQNDSYRVSNKNLKTGDTTITNQKNQFGIFNISTGIASSNEISEQTPFTYKADLNYYNLSTSTQKENHTGFNLNSKFKAKKFLFETTASIDYFLQKISNRDTSTTIINIKPRIFYTQKQLHLNAGINIVSTKKFYILPHLELSYYFMNNLTFISGLTSDYQFNSIFLNAQNNPYHYRDTTYSPTVTPYSAYIGFKGSVGTKLDYIAKGFYEKKSGLLLWANDSLNRHPNSFVSWTDTSNILGASAQLDYHTEDVQVQFMFLYRNFINKRNDVAWQQPSFQANLSAVFQLNDQIDLNASILFITGSKVPVYENKILTVNQLSGLFKLNAGATYKINKQLNAYFDISNLLNQKYQRYNNFTTPNFYATIGVLFKVK